MGSLSRQLFMVCITMLIFSCLILTNHIILGKKTPTTTPIHKHYDLPITPPPKDFSLETVQLYSRHGNRASDPIIEAICPKRRSITELYHAQQASYGALTYNGIKGMWSLGEFTHYQYIKTGFIDGTYTRLTTQIRAAASDRTLISASAWGQSCFTNPYANTPLSIPVAVGTSPPELDNVLEVRKARCAERLETDLHYFDEEIAPTIIKENKQLIDRVADIACGFDIMNGPKLTNGEFSVMQLVKDISDALTGDLLEGFPLMDGLSIDDRNAFLQFAENIFHQRHYTTNEMDAYLAGNIPNRMIKLFDRRVSFNTNTTVLEEPSKSIMTPKNKQDKKNPLKTYRDVIVEDAKRLPIIRPRPPRRMFAWHAHREALYGFARLLKFDFGVERPGLPTGALHPSTGMFFELWKNNTQVHELIEYSAQESILPVLNPNRKNSQRYLSNIVDDGYYIRILLWVPCFKDMEATSALDNKKFTFETTIDPKDDKDGTNTLCLGRVRTLEQCDNLEYCPLKRFKEIIATNYNDANGDFRTHCPVHKDLDNEFNEAAGFFTGFGTNDNNEGQPRRTRKFKTGTAKTFIAGFYGGENEDESTTTTTTTTVEESLLTTQQPHLHRHRHNPYDHDLLRELRDEIDVALESDSDSFTDYDERIDGPIPSPYIAPEHKQQQRRHRQQQQQQNDKSITKSASVFSLGQSNEDIYNNQYQSNWVNSLAQMKPQADKK